MFRIRLRNPSLYSVLLGATCWGLSGTAAQALFQNFGFPVLALVTIRMLTAGCILLLIRRPQFPRSDLIPLIILSIVGFVGSQMTYLFAIQFSNAATATLLQFLFLPMVAGYEALKGVIRWSVSWTATLLLAVLGTLFLIGGFSNGSFHILVTAGGLVFGLLAALTGAYNTLASKPLVRKNGSWSITTWGLVIGGALALPFGARSLLDYAFPQNLIERLEMLALVSFVIIFGTILGYGLYLTGLRRLTATEAGVSTSIEPISAAAAAYLFLGVSLTPLQYFGGALILGAVFLLAWQQRQGEKIVQMKSEQNQNTGTEKDAEK